MTAREMWAKLPESRLTIPDEVSDYDTLVAEIRAIRQQLTRLESDVIPQYNKVLAVCRSHWSEEEMIAAGFFLENAGKNLRGVGEENNHEKVDRRADRTA